MRSTGISIPEMTGNESALNLLRGYFVNLPRQRRGYLDLNGKSIPAVHCLARGQFRPLLVFLLNKLQTIL